MKYFFSIPDSSATRLLNLAFLRLLHHQKNWFYDDFIIETAYGAPGCCIWNGNRAEQGDTMRSRWKTAVLEEYRQYGIRYRLIFTNFSLQPKHLYDTYGNFIAKMCNDFGCDVMVSTPLMANYMKKYPKLRVCWSTTTYFGKTEDEQIKKINQLSAASLVVLPYEFNNREVLDRFEHPENLEILVNEKCIDNCPQRRLHWESNNKIMLMEEEKEWQCPFDDKLEKERDGETVRHHLVGRELFGFYGGKGITHFKMEGRFNAENLLSEYLAYFVREEFKENAKNELVNLMAEIAQE